MPKKKPGFIFNWRSLSPMVAIFRVRPGGGQKFPGYEAGQYISLHRENCRSIKKIGVSPDGQSLYGPDLDENGQQRLGPETHSYSISSAPYETENENYLEFFVNLEKDDIHYPGKPVESLFLMDLQEGSKVTYADSVGGDFTLRQRAAGYESVVMVGTGTGLAPFAAMIKQLFHETGRSHVQYTLFHANRKYEELGYFRELKEMEASGKLDFRYVPLVSRPTDRDWNDGTVGKGRAGNVLREVLGMPIQKAERMIQPMLPAHTSAAELRKRIDPSRSVVLACGNPISLADIKWIADSHQIPFEKEDW